MTSHGRGLLAINSAVLLFGTAGLFGKLLAFSPIIIVLGRVAFASLALVIYFLIRREKIAIEHNRSHYLPMILLGVILALHWVTFFKAIQISTVAIGLLSFSTFPVYVAVLEPLMCRERMTLRFIILALVALIGIRLLIPRFAISDNILQGVIWGSLSGLLFAVLTIINRRMVTHYRAERIALYQNLVATVCLLPFLPGLIHQITMLQQLFFLLILGVIFTALSHTLFIYGLKTINARSASIIACLEPLYGIFFAWLLLSEIPPARTLLGGAIIISTVFYTTIHLKQKFRRIVEERDE